MPAEAPDPPPFFKRVAGWIGGFTLVLGSFAAAEEAYRKVFPNGVKELMALLGKPEVVFVTEQPAETNPPDKAETQKQMEAAKAAFDRIGKGVATQIDNDTAQRFIGNENPKYYKIGNKSFFKSGDGWLEDDYEYLSNIKLQMVVYPSRTGIVLWNEKNDQYLNWPVFGGRAFKSKGNKGPWVEFGRAIVNIDDEPIGN